MEYYIAIAVMAILVYLLYTNNNKAKKLDFTDSTTQLKVAPTVAEVAATAEVVATVEAAPKQTITVKKARVKKAPATKTTAKKAPAKPKTKKA